MANENLKEQKRLQQEITSSAQEYSRTLAAALEEISSTSVGLNQARKAYRGLLGIADKVNDVQKGINRLSSNELKTLQDQSSSQLEKLSTGAKILKDKKKLSKAEQAILATFDEGLQNEANLVEILEEEIKLRQEIEDRLGLTGIALENLSRIGIRALGGLGVNLGALQSDFDEVTDTVEKLAKDGKSKFAIFGSAIAKTGPIFQKVITDPAVVSLVSISKLVDSFLEIEKSSIAFQRLTGQTAFEAASINGRLATTTQYLELATSLTEQLGINVNNAFRPDTLAAAAEIQNTLGLTAEQAGKLAVITESTRGSFDDVKNSIVDSVSAFNKANKVAISQGVVLQDVANISDDILASFNGQSGALASAAASARRLGLDLSRVDQVADSLLDFESSISNELQAQLLTGNELNLARARELALVNDLEGLGQELFNNSASLLEFSSMNRIAQEAQAKALGLSRQELAKIALQRSLELGLTSKTLEAAAGITAQDLERVAIQEQLNISIQKITQTLAGPAALLASMVESSTVLYSTIAAVASIAGTRAVLAFRKMYLQIARAGAASAFLRFGLVGIPAIAALVAGATLVPKLIERATKVDDGVIGPDGGLVVSGPKGSYQLNSGDTVVAGTNLGGTPAWASELISAFREGRDVYMDGNKVSQQLAISTFKSS